MAKKKTKPKPGTPAGQLADWLDEIPGEVQAAADVYEKAMSAKNKSTGKFNTSRDNLIDAMKSTGCKRCPIRGGASVIELVEDDKVRVKKREENDAD